MWSWVSIHYPSLLNFYIVSKVPVDLPVFNKLSISLLILVLFVYVSSASTGATLGIALFQYAASLLQILNPFGIGFHEPPNTRTHLKSNYF